VEIVKLGVRNRANDQPRWSSLHQANPADGKQAFEHLEEMLFCFFSIQLIGQFATVHPSQWCKFWLFIPTSGLDSLPIRTTSG
jgi:hypothetical protein